MPNEKRRAGIYNTNELKKALENEATKKENNPLKSAEGNEPVKTTTIYGANRKPEEGCGPVKTTTIHGANRKPEEGCGPVKTTTIHGANRKPEEGCGGKSRNKP